jgi:deoxyribodipyrimidine photolyase-related protein
VDQWYLGIYIDAIEWVEITNTRGMSQFADGGLLATKPYISSASYIDKMSDYCAGCFYNKNLKTGDRACPFNSLYWNFLAVNRKLLATNQRMSMMYSVWDKMDINTQQAIIKQAEKYLNNMHSL